MPMAAPERVEASNAEGDIRVAGNRANKVDDGAAVTVLGLSSDQRQERLLSTPGAADLPQRTQLKKAANPAGPKHVVAIGASAGGVETLQQLVAKLPSRLDAAICVVLHLGPESPTLLDRILTRRSMMRVTIAQDGMLLRPATIYVAQPDYHLVVDDGRIRLLKGPRENRHRPAIDVLFRSVADQYRENAIGVVLTGFLDDGSAGLQEIKRRGGFAIVQDPDDAIASEMPRHAIEAGQIDKVAPLDEIPRLLVEQIGGGAKRGVKSVKTAKNGGKAVCKNEASADERFSCPECGGPMEEQQLGKVQSFRCRVGHKYSLDSLAAANDETLERALWAAMQMLEQSATLNRRLAERSGNGTRAVIAKKYIERADEKLRHAQVLRRLLVTEDHRPLEQAEQAEQAV
jgi:two-component system chemotaxis response regulator CheB